VDIGSGNPRTNHLYGHVVCFFVHSAEANPGNFFSPAETAYIKKVLLARTAGDCVIESAECGWKCTEIKTGKVFKIRIKQGHLLKPTTTMRS
jgi:hypothetical protein